MDNLHVQLLSDLHLEVERSAQEDDLYNFDIPVKADMLALLGDIGWTRDDRLFQWLKLQLSHFKIVFFVSGNHEPYRSTMTESRERLVQFADAVDKERSTSHPSSIGRFILLDKTRFDLSSSVTILGCTLWSRLNPDDLDILRWSLTDFRTITEFDPNVYQTLHDEDLSWLNATVQQISSDEPHRRIIIFTHHAPTVDGTGDPKYIGGPTNSAFATELVNEPCWNVCVKVWAFGHTHWNCDFVRNGVRVVSNQRGYRNGSDGFSPETTLDLELTSQ